MIRVPLLFGLILGVSLQFICAPVQAQPSIIDRVSAVFEGGAVLVQAAIGPVLEQGRIDRIKFEDADGLRRFYEVRNFEPLWIDRRGRVRKVERLIEVLQESWLHGFNPYDYHMGELQALIENDDEESLYSLELLASDSVIRYVRDLSSMRVAPKMVSSTIRKLQKNPISEDVLVYLDESSNVKKALKSFEPTGNLYATLQAELYELVMGDPASYEEILPIRMQGLVRPGQGHRVIPLIRQRLEQDTMPAEGASFYDDALAKAVMAFQDENGLKPDGVIGPNTLNVLNITRDMKIERVIVNLERLRWIARETPQRYILVNIPSATLWAIERGNIVLDMPVILGRKKRETEVFVTDITGIRFNPNWTIPPTIKKEDFWPNLIEDPYYATNRGIEFVSGYGNEAQTLDPGTVDWSTITWDEFKNIRMIQDSGYTNPLGQIRVLMPNPYNIYLHDTNKRSDFLRDQRYLSSGCVRVGKPEELTNFIMQSRNDWSQQKLDDILRSGKLREVTTADRMPVFILYQTVWLGDQGRVIYGHDVYNRDRDLIRYMKANRLYMVPEKDKIEDIAGDFGR